MGGRRSFHIGARPIFRCKLLILGRVYDHTTQASLNPTPSCQGTKCHNTRHWSRDLVAQKKRTNTAGWPFCNATPEMQQKKCPGRFAGEFFRQTKHGGMRYNNTLPETNSSHLKTDGWKTIVSFWDVSETAAKTI